MVVLDEGMGIADRVDGRRVGGGLVELERRAEYCRHHPALGDGLGGGGDLDLRLEDEAPAESVVQAVVLEQDVDVDFELYGWVCGEAVLEVSVDRVFERCKRRGA